MPPGLQSPAPPLHTHCLRTKEASHVHSQEQQQVFNLGKPIAALSTTVAVPTWVHACIAASRHRNPLSLGSRRRFWSDRTLLPSSFLLRTGC